MKCALCIKDGNNQICLGFNISDDRNTAHKIEYKGRIRLHSTYENPLKYYEIENILPKRFLWTKTAKKLSIRLYGREDFVLPEKKLCVFFSHIAAMAFAAEQKDGLLAAELFSENTELFLSFEEITKKIIEPVAPEALFAWIYGRFSACEDFFSSYYGLVYNFHDTGAFLFEAAQKRLNPNPQIETPEQMFIRFFREEKKSVLTIPLVGTRYSGWLDSRIQLASQVSAVTKTKENECRDIFFSKAKIQAFAEPYNRYDKHAVGIYAECFENPYGNEKAGYIRKTGAEIIRAAKPGKFVFKAELARINSRRNETNGVVVRLAV